MLRRIENFMAATGIPATRIGKEVARDPRLVHDMRNGRQIGPEMAARLNAYLAARDNAKPGARA